MSAHAKFAPSKAHRWLVCTGSIAMEEPYPETTSIHAEDGIRAHAAAALLLEQDFLPADVPEDMAMYVRTYVDAVRNLAGGGEILVERRVDFSQFVGVPDQQGTADAVVLGRNEIQVHDLKYGMGVQEYAKENPQLMLYALGAVNEFDFTGEVDQVRLFIHQPRLDRLDEWVVSVDDLLAFAERAKIAAARAADFQFSPLLSLDTLRKHLVPGEKQCRFCKAKASCPVLAADVAETVFGDFDNLETAKPLDPPDLPTRLGQFLSKVPLVEEWCRAIRAEVERRLLAAEEVPGWKLVQGRRPPRAWSDAEAAEAMLKAFRLKVEDMYSMKLISPPQAEKLVPETIGERRWKKLQALITQGEAGLSVAPESDKRPAATPAASKDDFTDHGSIDDLL